MYPMDISRTVRLIIQTCLQVSAGQKLLIIGFSDDDLKLAAALAGEAQAWGAEAGIVLVEPPRNRVEPPDFLAAAMLEVDTIITLGLVDFGHSNARKQATAAKVSYFYIPDLMNEELLDLNIQHSDLIQIKERTLALARMVSDADRARITSAAGTDLEVDIRGRAGLALQPIYSGPGHFAIVPFYSEVACAPCEGRARGTVVVDGSIVGLSGLNGVVSEPIRWRVAEGRVVDVQGGKEARVLARDLPELGENADSLAELGIGTNFKMRDVLVGNRRDNAIFGHVHLALGRNVDLGGEQWSPIHADFMTRNITLELDGKPVIDQGRFLV